MDTLLAAVVVAVAVVAWTTWEAAMVSRLARDTRSLPRRNAAVAGAHRLTVVGQLGLVAVAVVVAGVVQVPLWWPTGEVSPVGLATTGAALVGAGARSGGRRGAVTARRNRASSSRWRRPPSRPRSSCVASASGCWRSLPGP